MADLLDELANLSLTDGTSAPQAAEEVALPDYLYKPLKDDGLFRLINLHPGSAYDDLMCTIYTEKLRRRDFTAVSYCWGSPERPHFMKCSDPKEIEIDSVVHHGPAEKPTGVTENPRELLLPMRCEDTYGALWIDQLLVFESV